MTKILHPEHLWVYLIGILFCFEYLLVVAVSSPAIDCYYYCDWLVSNYYCLDYNWWRRCYCYYCWPCSCCYCCCQHCNYYYSMAECFVLWYWPNSTIADVVRINSLICSYTFAGIPGKWKEEKTIFELVSVHPFAIKHRDIIHCNSIFYMSKKKTNQDIFWVRKGRDKTEKNDKSRDIETTHVKCTPIHDILW